MTLPDDSQGHGRVRVACPGDGVWLAPLEAEARAVVSERKGGPDLLRERPAVRDWDAMAVSARHRVWVATIDDVPLGYLVMNMAPTATGSLLVEQVFVTPEARELGLGAALVGAARAAAADAGAQGLDAEALPGDRETKNLYERVGMTARKIVVSAKITAEGGM